MSLYKQDGSEIWWADISIPGHPRLRRSTGELARPTAQRVHDEIKAALWKVDPALKGKTWGRAVDKWVAAKTRSDSELLSLAKFGRHYKDRLLSAMTPESIDKALSFCTSAATHTRYLTMISAILTLSKVELELTKRDGGKTEPRDWLTHEQWKDLHAQLPAHMRPMASFAVATGLRQANVLGLTWKRVDFERAHAWVEGYQTKSGKPIPVPLSEAALAALRSVEGQHPEFCFTFRGKPVKEIKTAFQAACIRAHVGRYDEHGRYQGFVWHGFRHTWATWHIQNGTPLEVLQVLGGWADLRMVMKYAHHSAGHLAKYANNTGYDAEL